MSRWPSLFSRRGGGPPAAPGGPRHPVGDPGGVVHRGTGGTPPVEDIDGVLLVRSVEDDSFPMATLAEVARAVSVDEDVVTVMVGSADAGGPDAGHWSRLGALLDSLRAKDITRIRLVMSGAGDDRPGQPCVARRIADAWGLEVTAPDGTVLVTPGGVLFVYGDSRPGCGWWHFAPGEAPRRLGPRAPAPGWQEALGRVPSHTPGGCVVDQIPAGVLMRPADAPGPHPDDLCFAVPVDSEHPAVLVGALRAENVAADEVAAVLAALPVAQRSRVRLAPGGRRDLLGLGQSVADMLGGEVEVLTGLPLLPDHAPPGATPRPTLVGTDGTPSWQPFVSSVACGPADALGRTPAPRLVESHLPDRLAAGTEPGTVRLTDRWQATVTRAGLALWERDGPRPSLAGPAVDPDTCAIELGVPGQPLDASLWPALDLLLGGLDAGARARTTLLVRGRLTTEEGRLRRLAAEHGVLGIRYVTVGGPALASPGAGAGPRPPVPPPTGRATEVSPPAAREEPAEENAEESAVTRSATASGEHRAVLGRVTPPVRHVSSSGPLGTTAGTGSTSVAVRPVAREPGSLPAPAGRTPPGRRPVAEAPAYVSAPSPDGPSPGGSGEAEAPERESAGGAGTGTSASVLGDTSIAGPPSRDPVTGDEASAGASARPSASGVPGEASRRAGGGEPAKPGPAPHVPAPEPARSSATRAVRLPFGPGHVSGAAEQAAFRDLAAAVWERHAAAVSRVLTRMPALRGQELEAARIDLVAAHAYLTTEEGPLHHRELIRDIRTGEGRLLPYAGCLASALRRLPSYRGVALRGGDATGPEPAVGALLEEPGPLSALARPSALPAGAGVRYAIWSSTGRKARQLLDRSAGSPEAFDEIVFVPGTAFRVLGVRTVPGGVPVVLLRELAGNATAQEHLDGAREFGQADLKALAHLEEAIAKDLPVAEERHWPDRCTGPVGHGG
ncbi:hypothetical protein GCM10023084_11790 [Streptomyces lacrimifluminis]|uniref:NAD(+)--protein-arginine ADP-ribosyltransferase n=1 Tax=Streptomyces lacrimifluminis TaxID=1500077 RepID=A0A917KN01_9ACTN|nr:hypothetical protein [Streptomyces lacrimifluminis]GGJ19698.1 hypothetical protein GCM10012282_14970 [Streptomyces lacrimifluminis]